MLSLLLVLIGLVLGAVVACCASYEYYKDTMDTDLNKIDQLERERTLLECQILSLKMSGEALYDMLKEKEETKNE